MFVSASLKHRVSAHVSLAAGLTEVMSRLVLCVSVIVTLWSVSVLSLSGGCAEHTNLLGCDCVLLSWFVKEAAIGGDDGADCEL